MFYNLNNLLREIQTPSLASANAFNIKDVSNLEFEDQQIYCAYNIG